MFLDIEIPKGETFFLIGQTSDGQNCIMRVPENWISVSAIVSESACKAMLSAFKRANDLE